MKILRVLLSAVLVATAVSWAQEEKREVIATTEMFRVGQIGRPQRAETREGLLDLYEVVAKNYDAKIKQERKRSPVVYAGERVRLLQPLGEKDDNGALYLGVYDGKPTVVSLADRTTAMGELTVPLLIQDGGTHDSVVTRVVTEKKTVIEEVGGLETIEDDEVPSFFGIPISDVIVNPGSMELEEEKKTVEREIEVEKVVTDKKTMPKVLAQVSTEVLEDGPAFMSQPLFLEMLKNGEVFTLKREEDRRCQLCRGFGRVKDERRANFDRAPDMKVSCPDCVEESGKIRWNVTYRIAW